MVAVSLASKRFCAAYMQAQFIVSEQYKPLCPLASMRKPCHMNQKHMDHSLTGDNLQATDSALAMLAKVIDWFMPSRIHDGDVDLLRRARLVVTIGSFLTLLMITYIVIFFLLDSPIGAVVLAIGAGMIVGSLFVMRQTGSSFVAGNLITATFFGVITALACRLGGYGSIAIPWYIGVPVVALSTAGGRSAVAWLATTILSLFAFFTFDSQGYQFINDLGDDLSILSLKEIKRLHVGKFFASTS